MSKIGIVVEEADETVYWLDLIAAAHISAGTELQWLQGEAAELSRIFNASQLTAKAQGRQ